MTRSQSRTRLLLSLVVEAGDPRLVAWRERCDPVELWQAVVTPGLAVPPRPAGG